MSWMSAIGNWAKSPAGQATIGAGANAAAGYATSKADRALSREELAQRAAALAMQDRLQRDQALTGAAPLGWSQNYQQGNQVKQMLMDKLTGGQAQSGFVPSDPNMAARLANRPGMQIPAEWQNVHPFGVGQTMDSIAQRQQVIDRASGGVAPSLNFSNYGIDPAMAARLQAQTGAYNNNIQNEQQNLMSAIGMANTPEAQAARAAALSGKGTGNEHHYTKQALSFADPAVGYALLKRLFGKDKKKGNQTPVGTGGGGTDGTGPGGGGREAFGNGLGQPTAPGISPGQAEAAQAELYRQYNASREGNETFEQWLLRTHHDPSATER